MALKYEPSADKPRKEGQCTSVFIPKRARCLKPFGHRGMHSANMGGGWIDHELTARNIEREEIEEATREGDRAFDELLGKES